MLLANERIKGWNVSVIYWVTPQLPQGDSFLLFSLSLFFFLLSGSSLFCFAYLVSLVFGFSFIFCFALGKAARAEG